MSTADAQPTPPHITVLSGQLTDAEVAAVTVALAVHLRRDAVAPPAGSSRWTRAARLEGRGHPPIDSPTRFPR